jgi:putative FmdB family regulatory protein
MPIYEFRCEDCGKINIRSLEISSKQETVVCDYCKEYKAKRIISQSSFMLKGGGWYADAYNKKEDK